MQKSKLQLKIQNYLTITVLLFVAVPVYAAQFVVEPSHDEITPQSEFIGEVWLDTQGESLNAFEGRLLFPENLLEIVEVHTGGSIILIWLDAPASRDTGSVIFSGITPGGYQGNKGFLFSVVFRTKEEGVGVLSLKEMQALKNDGNGTAAKVSSLSPTFSVSEDAKSSALPEIADTTPPEKFTIEVLQSPDAFDGKKVLIFATQDKGFGIDHYEVCEGLFASCVSTKSPYTLRRQNADSFVTVKAIDHSGNVRSAHLFTSLAATRYLSYGILAILLCMGTIFIWTRFKRTYSS